MRLHGALFDKIVYNCAANLEFHTYILLSEYEKGSVITENFGSSFFRMIDQKEDKKVENKRELSMNEMEKVSGGVQRTVNTGVDGLDAALRAEPRKSSRQIGHLPNGVRVDTVSDTPVFDKESGRNFVQVNANGKTGWIAASIIGLPR